MTDTVDYVNSIYNITVTGYNNLNIGSILQAYALHYVVRNKFNYPPYYMINYSDFTPNNRRSIYRIIQEDGLIYMLRVMPRYLMTKVKGSHINRDLIDFMNKEIGILTLTSNELIRISRDDTHSRFLVGSDLIWNPRTHEKYLGVFLLSFFVSNKSNRKASYAASVGYPIPDSIKSLYKKYLMDFDFISVREKSSALYLRDVLGYEPEVVLDPTLLLNKDEWLHVANRARLRPHRPYVFVYDLYRSEKIIPAAVRFAREEKLDLITYHKHPGISSFRDYGVPEFLYLVANAEYVITSSFHGVVFSCIFNRPFIAINPEPYAPKSRIADYLSMIGLEEKLLDNPSHITRSLFIRLDDHHYSILKYEKERSLSYLRRFIYQI